MKVARHKRLRDAGFHSYEVLALEKELIGRIKSERWSGLGGSVPGLLGRNMGEIPGSLGDTGICICQNLLNDYLRFMYSFAYKFYPKRQEM